jgi:hypothetical protein
MDVPDGLWSQTFRFLFRFDAVYPATIQQMLSRLLSFSSSKKP